MEIFGLDPVTAALVIASVGIIYSIGLGWAKSTGGLNGKKLIISVLIAIPGSLILVATGIRASTSPDDLTTLILIVGWILQISGTDFTLKGIASVIKRN